MRSLNLAGGFILGSYPLFFSGIPPIHAILKEHPEVRIRPNPFSPVDVLAPQKNKGGRQENCSRLQKN